MEWGARSIVKESPRWRSVRQVRTERRTEGEPPRPGVACRFGATRVGTLLERVRLHLNTQRFLAARRGDSMWEIGCDYAGLALERLGARMRPETSSAELFAARSTAQGSRNPGRMLRRARRTFAGRNR